MAAAALAVKAVIKRQFGGPIDTKACAQAAITAWLAAEDEDERIAFLKRELKKEIQRPCRKQ